MRAAGETPAAAAFVIDVCLPSWNGRIGRSICARLSAARVAGLVERPAAFGVTEDALLVALEGRAAAVLK
jgi:hypothetical protein